MPREHDPSQIHSGTVIWIDDPLPISGPDVDDREGLGVTRSLSDSYPDPIGIPELTSRYQISELLGEGGYGCVYKAFDVQLERHVAIKIPHRHRIASEQHLVRYLEEARTLAKLDHPAIVSIHDVVTSADGLPCIVSAYIDGPNLADRMRSNPLTLRQALMVLADIATALSYVHSRGIVHRDIKPGNILLSQDDRPFLADFGLALRDESIDSSKARIGTLAYMSPEQARGENHLVDGRSDLFSLGVILYQMLTGQRPFGGSDHTSIIDSLMHREPKPPRQWIGSIPRELERICLKLLEKRASDRYATATDLVDDFQFFLNEYDHPAIQADAQVVSNSIPASGSPRDVIIPRGLRSFGRHDSDFFHRLIPGPRDRQWVPESLRFWQRRIVGNEEQDVPRIGVLYGPSGCGKSSFVKAGLLPLLGDAVNSVFVEATRNDTESRLLRGLRKRYPEISLQANLGAALAEIRRGNESTQDRPKLLLIIDQFEQWLHGRGEDQDQELATALRQCDGPAVQCLLLVRDDFWLALSRFMGVLEMPLRQNHNAALVDLFGVEHARDVLAEFGVAYDRIPSQPSLRSQSQNRFLDRAVQGLSRGGKVFPVRLALFVEMIKSQPWEIHTLDSMGGIEGIGVQFLEESFSSEIAPAAQRIHEQAVRRVLRVLLPEGNVGIKGNMQPEAALLDASGYQNQRGSFQEMMRILDTDLRLITPTDPAGTTLGDESVSQSSDGIAFYQLTHDYLVPAIDRWITRRQHETRRGRAELRLAEYASLWSVRQISKYVPSWFDWATIALLSSPSRWNSTERKMMAVATRKHLRRSVIVAALLVTGSLIGWGLWRRSIAASIVQQLQTVRTDQLNDVLAQLRRQGRFAAGDLKQRLVDSMPGTRQHTLNQLGLLQLETRPRHELVVQSLDLDLPLMTVVHQQLGPLDSSERDVFLDCLRDEQQPPSRRLRAAIMLGEQISNPSSDDQVLSDDEADLIVTEMLRHATIAPQDNSELLAGLMPLQDRLIRPLLDRALQVKDSPTRSLSTAFAIQLLRKNPDRLLNFMLDASFSQQETILSVLDEFLPQLTDQIRRIAFAEIDRQRPEPEFDKLAHRQSVAAALLHRLGQPESTWMLFRKQEWPHVRGYLVNRIGPLEGDFDALLGRFSREPDVSIRFALLLAMGGFAENSIVEPSHSQAILTVKDAFTNDPDVGVHSAAEWFLQRWNQSEWVMDEIQRQSKLAVDTRKNWFVNAEGQTMAILDGRNDPEIGYVFAIATGEVSVEQYLRFRPDHPYYDYRSPTPQCPMGLLDWFDCAAYCRWLSQRLNADPDNAYPAEFDRVIDELEFENVVSGGAYRLPTPAEWRFACAALTRSRRFFGWSDALADDYFWYYATSLTADGENRYFPAGSKMPNDFGMFSLYDGVREWCHNPKGNRRFVMGFTNASDPDRVSTDVDRPIDEMPADLPLAINGFYGMRLARTITTR